MKKFKFLLAALLIIGLGLFATSCSSDEPEPTVTLTVAPASVDFTAAAGEKQLTVTTVATWSHKVADGATWLTVTKAGDKINVVAAANTGEVRTATITVSAPGAKNVVVTVTQAKEVTGAATLTVDPQTASFAAVGGEELLAVTTNAVTWSFVVEAGASWLTVTKPSATQLKVVAANYTGTTADRTAKITVSAEGATDVVVTVTQAKSVAPLDLSYEILAHNYSATGTPYFDGPTAWTTPLYEIEDIKSALISIFKIDMDYTPNPGSKFLAMTFWGDVETPMFLEYTTEGKVAFPKIEQFIDSNGFIAVQEWLLATEPTGQQVFFGTFANNRIEADWDPITRSISSTKKVFTNPTTQEEETLYILPTILEYDATTLKPTGKVYVDAYRNTTLTQTTPLPDAAPTYRAATMPRGAYNPAKSPYRDVGTMDLTGWTLKN